MPTTLFSYNADSDTAGANPTGFTSDSNITVTTTRARSGTKSLVCTPGASGSCYATGVQDGNSGNAQVTCEVAFDDHTNASSLLQINCREQSPAIDGSFTAYQLIIGGDNITLNKRVAGSSTTLVSTTVTLSNTDWFKVTIVTNGSSPANITVFIQRSGDGAYLAASGAWTGSAGTPCINYNDSTSPITGQGYAGLRFNGGFGPYMDNFLFESLAGGAVYNVSVYEKATPQIFSSDN